MPAARTPLPTTGIALAVLAGTGACLSLPALPGPWVIVAGAMLALVLVFRRAWLPGAAVAAFAWTALHAGWTLERQVPAEPARYDTIVEGRIATLPRVEPRRVVFDFDVDHDAGARVDGRRVRVSWYSRDGAEPPALRAGERWRLALRLRAPRGLRNPGGSDAEMHAFADRLAATGYLRGTDAQRLGEATGLAGWRDATSSRIAHAVPAAEARFVRALALGDTRHLDDADWLVLRANGLTHLIAISGFHVGMVAGAAAWLVRLLWWLLPGFARRMPARIAAALAGTAVAGAYAAASGFSLPTVRTLLMIVVVMLAIVSRRAVGMVQALALALLAILLVEPMAVLSAGFWLSFMGVAWLLWCMPRSGVSAAGQLVRAQAVASLGLLPFTVLLFGQASLAGPVANLVAVPWWSLVVAPLSVLGVGLDLLHPAIATPVWRLAAWCFGLSWPLFEALAGTGLALVWLPEAPALAMPLALAGAFWLLLPRGTPRKPLALLLWLPLLWPDTRRPPEGAVELTALDVGQGTAVVVRTRRHQLLYDAGPAVPDGFDAGERVVVPALRALGVRQLHRLVVSHGDLDHAGGVDAVRAALPVREALAPADGPTPGTVACEAGQAWTWDGVRFEFLHPAPFFPYLANESSCVLRIEGAHGTILLTGDIGELIEQRLVREQPEAVRADVVLVPHHGSRHSSSPAFVAATGARHALVSRGHANRYRHPNASVVRRWRDSGAEVHDTALSGALRVRLDADGVTVSERRRTKPRLWDAARRSPDEVRGLSYRRD